MAARAWLGGYLPLAKGGCLVSKRRVQDWLAIIVLGVIEGVTEFLPMSSTGHLLLAEHWLPRQSDLFNVVIQCGAVVAVIPLFPERWRQVFFRWRERATRDFVLKALAAFALTGVGGVVLDKLGFELPEAITPVSVALVVGGILFVAVERWLRGRTLHEEITWTVAVAVGLGQLVAAVFPGTSRSGATILLLLALGLSRPAATEFSFLVGIPTMLAAGGLKIAKALQHGAPAEHWGMVGLGTIVSAAVSFVVVRWLLRFVQTHTFTGLGWYRVAAGLAMLALAYW